MTYELKNAWLTIRGEGFKALPGKILTYFRHIRWAMRFVGLQLPHGRSPTEILDFSFSDSGKLIAPTQFRSEIQRLAELVHQQKPRTIVEIGTEKGGTLAIWCALADPKATVVSIDLPGGIHGGGYPNWRTLIYRRFALPSQTLHLLRADSHQSKTRDHLKTLLPPDGIDFLFIDGDHTYEGVKMDFDMYSPLVRKGGLVAFHDVSTHPAEKKCDVDKFWREVRTKFKSWEYIDNPKQDRYGIGVLEL
jgi:predicted O-methyltransferase YrrM